MSSNPRKLSPSMQDVADAAGVHNATVSRALREDPRISPEVRHLVRETAERLGYRPNPLVSALMSHRRAVTKRSFTGVIALVTLSRKVGEWPLLSPAFTRIYQAANRQAERHGYRMDEFCIHDPELNHDRFSDVMRARGIHGCVIAPLPEPQGEIHLKWELFSCVTISYSLVKPDLHRVATDHFQGLSLAMQKCRERGYRRLGLVLAQGVNRRSEHRWLGAWLVESQGDGEAIPALIMDDFKEPELKRWFKRYRPEVIITPNFELVRPVIESMELAIPREVGLVSLDADRNDRTIGGIDQNFEQTGAATIDFLVAMMHRGERGLAGEPQKLLINGSWVHGSTI